VHLRDDADRLRADPAARAVLVARDGVVPDPVPLAALKAAAGGWGNLETVFLGMDAEGPLFAVEVSHGAGMVGLREAASTLPGDRAGLLAYAAALLHWARTTRFCGQCGRPTEALEGGHLRVCAEGHNHHPRTDPVVIMLVARGDRVLLGRQAAWPKGRYSALAGFVEPGEALESAVAREVHEEAAVVVTDVRYVASQPWPFPASLMLGFQATYATGDPAPRDEELEDVRWFSRDEVAAAAREHVEWTDPEERDGGLLLPPRTAIARVLIERWLAG
jgi:NAD+ diphosphatase